MERGSTVWAGTPLSAPGWGAGSSDGAGAGFSGSGSGSGSGWGASSYGISVVHDRTLHDGESYNDAYENSLASIQSYLAKYPSIVYVLDLHRDAVQDANGTQYKLVTAEDPAAAQVSLIMGVAHDGWQDNLRLAIAVQEKLESQSPTLMRPITLLNYRYNQFAAPGSLLVEVGAAGNSLDEALRAARLFAKGFAETILGR